MRLTRVVTRVLEERERERDAGVGWCGCCTYVHMYRVSDN